MIALKFTFEDGSELISGGSDLSFIVAAVTVSTDTERLNEIAEPRLDVRAHRRAEGSTQSVVWIDSMPLGVGTKFSVEVVETSNISPAKVYSAVASSEPDYKAVGQAIYKHPKG